MNNLRYVSVLTSLFCWFAWVRKRAGGKWERWSVNSAIFDHMWYPVDYFSFDQDRPAQMCINLVKREDWQ